MKKRRILSLFLTIAMVCSIVQLGSVPAFAAAPQDQNFDSIPATKSEINGTLTFSGVVYSTDATGDQLVVDTISNITGGYTTLGTGNGISATWSIAIGTYFQFASSSNSDNFKLVSYNAEVFSHDAEYSQIYKISGYDNGAKVAEATVDFAATGTKTQGSGTSEINTTRLSISSEAGSNCQALTFTGSAWANIDQVRMTASDASPNTYLGVMVDNIDFDNPEVPTINSLARQSPASSLTNASTVTYRATFGAGVTGVTTSNFDLNPSVTGASISSVAAVEGSSNTQWDITVNTGTGDGTLTPRLVNDTGLSRSITTEKPYWGQSYTIDKTAPTLSSVTSSAVVENNVSATSSEAGTVYLVAKPGTNYTTATKNDLVSAAVQHSDVTSGSLTANLSTTALFVGNYQVYAVDAAGNVSSPAAVTVTAPLVVAPTVTTQTVTNVTAITATGNGNITGLGVPNPTQYGVVWSTSSNPTVALPTKTTEGVPASTGAFTSSITGLTANTTYSVRAYVTNGAGTVYGNEVSFTTKSVISTAAIPGVIVPVIGATPVSGIVDTAEYMAAISWMPNDTAFKASTPYLAVINITPKAGYTLAGVPQNFFQVPGAVTTNTESSGIVTAAFPPMTLPAPSAPILSAAAGNESVDLSWNSVAGATSYKIYKGTVSGAYGSPVTTATDNSKTITGLTNGTTYYFVIKASNASGDSTNSNEITVQPQASLVTAAINSVSAANGTVSIVLDKVPTVTPTAANFTATSKIGSGTANSLSLSNFAWDALSKTITFRFMPIVQTSSSQSVIIAVSYKGGTPISSPAFTVNAAPNKSSATSSSTTPNQTETKVDTTGNSATVTTKPDSVTTTGNTADMQVTVPSVTTDNTLTNTRGSVLDATKKTAVTVHVPTEAILQQLTAKRNVDLTMTVPSDVARDANKNVAVTINANKEVLQAAKENLSDVTIKIKDADTQRLAYSWTFKGTDLAKSKTPMTDVNIAMSVHLTTEVPMVDVITPNNKGMVLSFDHNGVLPSVASVRFSALEKGFRPGQTLYFYYYNPTTKQIESLGKDAYTVDADGYVTVQIVHCSDYVLLPNAARSLTLDTLYYTMGLKGNYEIGFKLINAAGTTIKVYSSTRGVATITRLQNGNYKVTGAKAGLTYIMFDVYDEKGKLIPKAHASVRLTAKKGMKPIGNSTRQVAIF